jgi:hypothetical protein
VHRCSAAMRRAAAVPAIRSRWQPPAGPPGHHLHGPHPAAARLRGRLRLVLVPPLSMVAAELASRGSAQLTPFPCLRAGCLLASGDLQLVAGEPEGKQLTGCDLGGAHDHGGIRVLHDRVAAP